MLTATQEKFIAIANELEAIKQQLREKNTELENIAADIGIGKMFQAQDTTVYKIDEPKGTFVTYNKIGYVRTKRATEDRGTLSMKEAEEAGFKVK